MNLYRKAPFIAVLLLSSGMASADEATRTAAVELMDALDMKALLAETIEQSMTVELEKNPALIPYRKVFVQFLNKHMGYDSIKDDLAAMYAETFTEQELKELSDFYRTPVGRKSIKTMPELMVRGGKYGEQKVRDNIAELQSMIAEEATRIQALQSN